MFLYGRIDAVFHLALNVLLCTCLDSNWRTFMKHMATWSKEETLKLIKIWSKDAIQAMLESARRNKDVFLISSWPHKIR